MLRKRQDTLSLDSAHEGERAWAEKLPGVTSSPEEQIILLEVTRQLETLEISSLNIMLLKVAGMKDKEIATATNSTVAAVKTRIFRARRQIEATFA
jgi:DNA-directed RNA polymerase specialized sigma24 family protein